MSLEKMIADAEKAALDAPEEEKAGAQATVETLKRVKDEGYSFSQKDLNAADKKTREAFNSYKAKTESLIGDPDEFAQRLQKVVPNTDDQPASGDDEASTLDKIFAELRSRDEALETERQERLSFQRELKQRDVYDDLNKRFKALDLQDDYVGAAREFVEPRIETLMDRVMQGEDISSDLQKQAERLKELSPVWFEKPQKPGDLLPPPGVPRSPEGGQPKPLTNEERLARAQAPVI